MDQYRLDDHRVFNASDHPRSTTAEAAGFHIYTEHPLESLCPRHCYVALRGRFLILTFCHFLAALAPFGWRHPRSAFAIGRKYTVKARLCPHRDYAEYFRRPPFLSGASGVPTAHSQSPSRKSSSRSLALKRTGFDDGASMRLRTASFISRSASMYWCVVAMSSWPSHIAMTVMSTPDCSKCKAVVWRLCRSRHSRHYLPFLIMSSNLMDSAQMFGNYRSCHADLHTITRHSFPG